MDRKITIPNEVLIEEVADRLNAGQEVILLTRGYSMMPFLHNEKDSVLLYKKEPEVDDIALARLHISRDGKKEVMYVLHRVISIDGEVVTMMGDGNIRGQERCRKEDADNSTMKIAKLLLRPVLANIVVAFARLTDRYGILPRYILNASPFHTSMFITNLASIGMPAVQHHIYNFGTCSQFISIGSVERTTQVDAKGNVTRKRLLPLGLVCDERIAEGAMYAKMLSLMGKLLSDPEQLETPPAKVYYDEGHEYHLPKPKRRIFKMKESDPEKA